MRHSPEASLVSPADLAACRALLRNGSRSFLAASRLLPRGVRDDAVALYAFCRVADDAIDQAAGGRGAAAGCDAPTGCDAAGRGDAAAERDAAAALGWLRERLALAYAGRPMPIEADRALADLVSRRGIPMALPAALLEGFAWDAAGRRYEDLSQLIAYAVRVAGSVGAMMALLMNVRAPEVVARACDLGIAMQLSNIARDVGEDARAGRLYLPLCWLREAGLDPDEWLARPVFNDALGSVIRRLLDVAEALYRQADSGIASLPAGCRPGIRAARLLYAGIGHEVARRGYDSVSGRSVVSVWRKFALVAQGFGAASPPIGPVAATPLHEATFLIAAVADATARYGVPHGALAVRSGPRQRLVWLIDFFAQLERREQFGRAGP